MFESLQDRAPADIYRHLQDLLRQGGVSEPALEARLILARRAGLSWADVLTSGGSIVAEDVLQAVAQDVRRRLQGEPLSRIEGQREFYGFSFALSPDTLDPRPESELLIDLVRERVRAGVMAPPLRILDLGTGTGCLALTLLRLYTDAHAVAVDRSAGALRTARGNADSLGVLPRFSCLRGDWAHALAGRFDLIVSNPPYIRREAIPALSPEVRDHDPILALDGGETGLEAYKNIFPSLSSLMADGGRAFFEIGFDQGGDVMRLAVNAGLNAIGPHRDYAGLERVVEITCGDK